MIRMWIGAGLLAVLLAAGILAGGAVRSRTAPAAADLRRAGEAALAEDWETAEALTEAVRARWLRFRKPAQGLADHAELEQIEISFAQLSVCAGRDGAAYGALCAALAQQLDSLREVHGWSLENLL